VAADEGKGGAGDEDAVEEVGVEVEFGGEGKRRGGAFGEVFEDAGLAGGHQDSGGAEFHGGGDDLLGVANVFAGAFKAQLLGHDFS
jgi:hypothetical protein